MSFVSSWADYSEVERLKKELAILKGKRVVLPADTPHQLMVIARDKDLRIDCGRHCRPVLKIVK